MRIVHVVCSDRFAGVEQFVLRLAAAQAAAGHDVQVLGGAAEGMREPLRAAAVSWAPVTGVREAAAALRRLRRTAEVVNTHMTDADVAAVLGLGRSGPALVSTRHFASRRGRALGVPIDVLVRGRVDAEIAISSAVAAAAATRATIVHSGVPATAGTPRPERIVLMAQRLQPEKGTENGIRAFVASGLAHDGWRLDIAGDGALRPHLQRLIDELDAGRTVRLLGFRDDVPALLETAGLFLAPCEVEGLGLAVLEAMSAGVAPVAAAAAGHRDVLAGLDERSGYRPGDIEDAAAALRVLGGDEQRRARLARSARERAHTAFSLAAQVERTDDVYRTAVGRRRRVLA